MDQSLENAIRFISDALCENPKADKVKLIEAANMALRQEANTPTLTMLRLRAA